MTTRAADAGLEEVLADCIATLRRVAEHRLPAGLGSSVALALRKSGEVAMRGWDQGLRSRRWGWNCYDARSRRRRRSTLSRCGSRIA